MRIAKVARNGQSAAAIIRGNMAHVVGAWHGGDPVATPFDLASFDGDAQGKAIPLADLTLLPPCGPLTKLICLGLNYKNHVEETANELPAEPSLFTKFPDALVGHEAAVVRPLVSEHFDYEGEIAVVIGKPGRHLSRENALDHVFGYTIMLDGSIRDYQKHSVSAGKNFWRSGSLGPWIVTADEIPDPTGLQLETRLNGQTVQSTSADLMLYDIPTAIAYISRWTPLWPGDVIATGTPGGVGARRTPPLWMRKGDRIEVEVSRIGVLCNDVIDE